MKSAMNRRVFSMLILSTSALSTLAISLQARAAEPITISGSIGYRERILPPPAAVAQVKLEDVSRADAPAKVLAEHTFTLDTAPPYHYTLEIDPEALQPTMRYTVRAQIFSGAGQLLWTSDRSYPIDASAGSQTLEDIELKRVGTRSTPESTLAARLAGAPWRVERIDGRPVVDRSNVTLNFRNGALSGSTGCNDYRGDLSIHDDGTLEARTIATTRRACIPSLSEQEARFLEAIGSLRHARIRRDGALVLRSTERGDIIAFQ